MVAAPGQGMTDFQKEANSDPDSGIIKDLYDSKPGPDIALTGRINDQSRSECLSPPRSLIFALQIKNRQLLAIK